MQHDICIKFGNKLKSLREEKDISLNMLAFENDLNKSTLSRIENGKVDPKLSTLEKIAKSLDIPIKDLLDF